MALGSSRQRMLYACTVLVLRTKVVPKDRHQEQMDKGTTTEEGLACHAREIGFYPEGSEVPTISVRCFAL